MAATTQIARLHCLLATYAAVERHDAFSWLMPVRLPGVTPQVQLPEMAS